MFVKLLVLGRPGSGKTTAYHYISALLEKKGWSVTRIRDYGILQRMFEHDIEGKKFRKADYGGFDVIDFSVLENALIEVESQVRLRMLTTKAQNELVLIEIARSDYSTELRPFSSEFLRDTHILFVDTDVETCIERIHRRVTCSLVGDNHFVSEHILKSYYGHDNMPYMKHLAMLNAEVMAKEKNVESVVQYVENACLLSDFHTAIGNFVNIVIEQEERLVRCKKDLDHLALKKKKELTEQKK